MNSETFNKLVLSRITDCGNVLGTKNEEYSSDTDRLHNFKKAGRMKGQDPIQALDGMWLKHRVSIDDMIEKMIADPLYVPSPHFIKEKIGDNINYSLLLCGLIEDRREELENRKFLSKSKK